MLFSSLFGGDFLERAILSDLKTWKTKKDRKPMIIRGVRQCGKTYIIKEF